MIHELLWVRRPRCGLSVTSVGINTIEAEEFGIPIAIDMVVVVCQPLNKIVDFELHSRNLEAFVADASGGAEAAEARQSIVNLFATV